MSKPQKRRRSRSKCPGSLPKGSFRLPDGGYVLPGKPSLMSNGRHLRVEGVVHPRIDTHRLAKLIVQMARDQVERQLGDDDRPLS